MKKRRRKIKTIKIKKTGKKIKDINEHPEDWEKIGENKDPKQPRDGKSLRELWRNKKTGESLEKHILEREGETPKGHPIIRNQRLADRMNKIQLYILNYIAYDKEPLHLLISACLSDNICKTPMKL